MLAGSGVDAALGQREAFHRAIVNQVGLDDLGNVGGADMTVPDGIGIHDNIGAMLALVQASGAVDADGFLEARRGDGLIQQGVKLGLAVCIATGAGSAFGTLIGTYEKMSLILRQEFLLRSDSFSFIINVRLG